MQASVELLNESSEKHSKALDKLRELMLKTLKLNPKSSQSLQKSIFAIITKISPFIEEVNALARNPEYMLADERPEKVANSLTFNDSIGLSFQKSKEKRVAGAIYLEDADPILISKLLNGTLYAQLETLGNKLFAFEKRPLMSISDQKQLVEFNAARNFILTLEYKKKDTYVVDFLVTGKEALVEMAPQRFITIKEEGDEQLLNMAISHGFNEGNDPQLIVQSNSGSYFFKSIANAITSEKGVTSDSGFQLGSAILDQPSYALHKDLLFVFNADQDNFYQIVVYKLKPGSRPTAVPQTASDFKFSSYKSIILREKVSTDKSVHIHLFLELDDSQIHHSVYGADGKRIADVQLVDVSVASKDQKYKIKGMSYNVEKEILCVLVNSKKTKEGVKVLQYLFNGPNFSALPNVVEKLQITMAADFNERPIIAFSADLNTPSKDIILFLCTEGRSYSFVSKGSDKTSKTKKEFRLFNQELNLAVKSLTFNPCEESLMLMIERKQEVDDQDSEETMKDSSKSQLKMSSGVSQSKVKASTAPQRYLLVIKVDQKAVSTQ